jgi:hypothetical protein
MAVIDSAIKGRHVLDQNGTELLEFQSTYRPESTLFGHLQFALRYEGINLEVLFLLFQKTGRQEIEKAIAEQPESTYARRLGFLYEWLTREDITASVAPRAAYVPLVDDSLQYGLSNGRRNAKFRVADNLPGNQRFCPLVRKTPAIESMVRKNLKHRIQETISRYDPDLLRRAAAFLYLKETHSSFEVEREKPSPDRAKRFADLLRDAESGAQWSDERFVQLQNAIVDPRFKEFAYRVHQVWVGKDLGYRKKVDFVPARPEDVPDLMHGLVSLSEIVRGNPATLDPVIAATLLAFGFVFVHPFMDGNGRIHRFLIHDVLSNSGFTPKGIVLPVSAVILANLDQYISALEAFSKPLQDLTKFDPQTNAPASGNDVVYFRYFDATPQAFFLYWALERTIEHDLQEEIHFLLGFDKAYAALKADIDWPGHSLDLFIRLVHQNAGSLSKGKRDGHFAWMTDEELTRSEQTVRNAFDFKTPPPR